MKKLLFVLCICIGATGMAQQVEISAWQFWKVGDHTRHPAQVPGNIYSDLYRNKLIADPFFGTAHSQLSWVDSSDWVYGGSFFLAPNQIDKKLTLRFPALDTYAEIRVNGKFIGASENMFRAFTANITGLRAGDNEITILFHSALRTGDSLANLDLPTILPDHPRVYIRKAQYASGWDFGPVFRGAGILQPPVLAFNGTTKPIKKTQRPIAGFVSVPDSAGRNFYFTRSEKPIYVKGANWIPANIFPSEVTDDVYRELLILAKKANMNMLRVWGGGIYEKDIFYRLCDSLDIMVWQDLMFANGMVPGDERFFGNVKAEVSAQVRRLSKHPCVVLWCGNNEIDEGWHNWGWQNQFNLHGADSARVWNDYRRLFQDSIPKWISDVDTMRPYISTSPMHGWGRARSFTEGDSHYWGMWWGLEDWQKFKTHTGRFVSEYGMQSMPHLKTVESFTDAAQRFPYSAQIQSHQRANAGLQKLHHYLCKYFIDSNRLKDLPLDKYIYLTQVMQAYILKNSIAVHRSKAPYNMGTMLWQLNDCWPGISWSIIDFYKRPKAAWYVVREAYRDDVLPVTDTIIPRDKIRKDPQLRLVRLNERTVKVTAGEEADYVWLDDGNGKNILSENFFHLAKNESKIVTVENSFPAYLKLWSLYDILNSDIAK